ncbi:MAG: hypothetical protein Q9226_006084 [Calogaya cf. arnoldii]
MMQPPSMGLQSTLEDLPNQLKQLAFGRSCLEDLPLRDPGNNYTVWSNGERVPSSTKMSPDKHIFYFKFLEIPSKHVQCIKTVLLEKAINTEALAYHSKIGILRALEAYLRGVTPSIRATCYGQLGSTTADDQGDAKDQRRTYLGMLERVAQGMGSQLPTQYN